MVTAADAPAAVAAGGPTTDAAAPKKSGFFPPDSPFIVGAYNLSEVRDYTGTPVALSRRFVESCKGREGLWGGKKEKAEGRLWVTFRDLLELRFINALHQAGLPWWDIRKLGNAAWLELELDYPFASPQFQEAGPAWFQRVAGELVSTGESGGIPAFGDIIPPPLYESVDYDGDTPLCWYPGVEWGLPEIGRWVALTPGIGGGQPAILNSRLFTWLMARDYYAEERRADLVARTYRRTPEAILATVAFEEEWRRRNGRPPLTSDIAREIRRRRRK